MWWAAAASGAMQVFGGLMKRSAGRRAMRLAKMNADLDFMESGEEMRRMAAGFQETLSTTKAISSGRGLSTREGDSTDRYIDRMVAEHNKQYIWAQKARRKRREITIAGGRLARSQANASAFSSFGSAIGSFGSAYSQFKG